MSPDDKVKLLHGPYQAPSLRVGDRATCLYRDCDVVVTSWTDAPISWPRCRPVGVRGSFPTLFVDDELARAIRTESALAIKHHWRVGMSLVAKWRRSFGIGRTGTEGSARLHRAAAPTRALALQNKEWSEEERQLKRRIAVEGDFGARLEPGYHGPLWSDEELALLGTDTDKVIALRLGKNRSAVRSQRVRRKIPPKK